MKLGKKELIISIVMLIVFIIIGLNFSVFATSTSINFNLAGNNSNNSNTIPQNNVIPQNNTIEKDQERPQNNTVIPTNNTTNTNTNNSSTKDVPNTGLEDAPWLIIAVCGVSAIFAYKKIKEYNQI